MDELASRSTDELNELFTESATRRNIATRIIEKDFWVCWTLKRLFELPEISPYLIFKGGTSLSKVYGVIERFSEDIDVSINREYLGFSGEQDPLNIAGTNKRKDTVEQIKAACKQKVQTDLIDQLNQRFSELIGSEGWDLTVDESDRDGQTLLFAYPRLEDGGAANLRYVKPIIRIELGARAEHYPFNIETIIPYLADDFAEAFSAPKIQIKVLAAERTFWEKATILHDQYHRSEEDKTADRISRHYYDLFKLSATDIAKRALTDRDLLRSVVENKKIFFTRAASKYDEALAGNIHLIPKAERLKALRSDYDGMEEMFFSTVPALDEILERLANLEREINKGFTQISE